MKVRCRLALLQFLISCLILLDLVASLPLIKERILVIILLLHFLILMLGSVLVLMLPLLVWLTPDLRIKKSLLKCNWTIRKRLPRCKMRLKKRLLAFSRRFFFQAEDGIRDPLVTGVQTCALPISATVLTLDHQGPAIYNIVDDEPATTAVWLTELAKILGARPPQRYPRLPARIFAGEEIGRASCRESG